MGNAMKHSYIIAKKNPSCFYLFEKKRVKNSFGVERMIYQDISNEKLSVTGHMCKGFVEYILNQVQFLNAAYNILEENMECLKNKIKLYLNVYK